VRKWGVVGLAVLAVAGASGGAWWLWGRGGADAQPMDVGELAGDTIARGVVEAMTVAEAMHEAYPCARLDDAESPAPPTSMTAFGRTFEREGQLLAVSGGDKTLVIGFVADAREPTERTLTNLAGVRAAFEKHKVELVVSLGGMGTSEAQIEASLGALAHNAKWPVVAIPGGRESIPAHTAAIASLSDGGRSVVFDGARVRVIAMDGASIGTLPGIADPSQLIAGNEGCSHGVESLVELATLLGERPAPRVLASYAPPRQSGETASDVAAGHIHIGEDAVARAVAVAKPAVVAHGLVDEAADDPKSGAVQRAAAPPLIVGAGSLDGEPLWLPDGRVLGGSAIVVTVGKNRTTWRRIPVPVGVD